MVRFEILCVCHLNNNFLKTLLDEQKDNHFLGWRDWQGQGQGSSQSVQGLPHGGSMGRGQAKAGLRSDAASFGMQHSTQNR